MMKKTWGIKRHTKVSNTMPQEEYRGFLGSGKRNSCVPTPDSRPRNESSVVVTVFGLALASALIGGMVAFVISLLR